MSLEIDKCAVAEKKNNNNNIKKTCRMKEKKIVHRKA